MIRRALLLSVVLLGTIGGAAASAAEPPNQNDPCAQGGRNTCGTTGKGSYRTYEFGPRWFGDYRGAIAGVDGPAFCIDLRYWYPSRSFKYVKRSAAGLRNRDGAAISASDLRRMSFALWRFGRSDSATQQAAVMLYVHKLMGDGAPGEVVPSALSAASRKVYRQVVRDAGRYAGPYRVRATLPDKLVAGREAEAEIQVVGAAGRPVPGVEVALRATGAGGLPATVDTGASGIAKVKLTPTDPAAGVTLDATAASLPADLPALYVPSRRAPARNGQRLAVPASAPAAVTARAPVSVAPKVVTQVSAQAVAPGATITERVVGPRPAGQPVTVVGRALRPVPGARRAHLRRRAGLDGRFVAAGDGELRHRSGDAHGARLLHLPRVDRGVRRRARRDTPVRRGGGDDGGARRADDPHGGSAQEPAPGSADHRHRRRHRARQAAGDRRGRAVGPVPVARAITLPGHAVVERRRSTAAATAPT